ncbi:hypothetical protein BGZ95_008689 [Linnemannia exigua]|uniref:Uncharacterized protein n=1 Tax=Linnemannia exigua TaxID=604196 RepID=A0AAD4HB36_9FUNG|nr:hypothetical protein BGZ95_008689 [Linnemannia exigua]
MGNTEDKRCDKPIVFTDRFFRDALRFDPKHSCRVVFLPDVDHAWVTLNIVPNFRAPYVLRLLESLIYLRSYTPAERVKYLLCAPSTSSSSSSTSSSKKRSRRDEEPVLVTININKGTAVLHQNHDNPNNYKKSLEPFLLTQPETTDHERWQLMNVHKIVPDKNSNVDQDLWRLYELWLLLRAYHGEGEQEAADEVDEDDADKACSSGDQADDEEDDDERDEGPNHKRACRQGLVDLRLHLHPHRRPHRLPRPNRVAAARNNTKCKRSPFPTRPQIRLLLEDDVYYLRKVDSAPLFDRFIGRADYGVEPPLPAVELQSLLHEGERKNSKSNKKKTCDKPQRVATVTTGTDRRAIATLPGGPTPAPTPLVHAHRRRHHDRNQKEVRYHPHQNQIHDQGRRHQDRQNGDRRCKPPSPSPTPLSPPTANYGHVSNESQRLQCDPQLANKEATEVEQDEQVEQTEQVEHGAKEEEAMVIEQDEANSIEQEKEEAMIPTEPSALASLATTGSTQQLTTSTSVTPATAATVVPSTFLPLAASSISSLLPPPVSLDAAYTIWIERNQQRARDEARRNLYSQYRDPSQSQNRAQRELEFLSPEHKVFGVDLVNRRGSGSISPPTLSSSSSPFVPSLSLSQSQSQGRPSWSIPRLSRWNGGGCAGTTAGTATITRAQADSKQEKDNEEYDCADDLDMIGMTL